MYETNRTQARIAAAVLLIHAVTVVGAFFALAATFEFPGVLREPALRILELFRANQGLIQSTYYAFTLTGVTFIAMAFATHEATRDKCGSWGRFALIAGVLAGITQAIGFIRWVWLVPTVAGIATDPTASPASRDAALVVFESFHQFAGVSVGENLSFLFQGLWTLALGIALFRHSDRRLGALGIFSGGSFILYTAEQFGGAMAWLGDLNVVFHVLWVTFLALLAASFFRGQSLPRRAFATAGIGAMILFLATQMGS